MPKATTEDTLLKDCVVKPSALTPLLENLATFAARYRPLFTRREQGEHCQTYLEGLLSGLERKSVEPIATDHDQPRRPLQLFVGAGAWDDDAVMTELRVHVREELGDDRGILVLDPSSFPKKGTESVGVKRQWCGRLGKEDNCQVGVFMTYVSKKGHALVDRRLYLPKEWAASKALREKCFVAADVKYRSSWQIADDMLMAHGAQLPHEWVIGDEEFGRIGPFRESLRSRKERYLLSIACNTLVQDLEADPLPRARTGRPRKGPPYRRVDEWAKALPDKQWKRVHVRDGEKAPIELLAVTLKVHARKQSGDERLLVTKTRGKSPEYRYWITNELNANLVELVRVAAERHWVEQDFQRAKGQVGLHHYEVRSWVGWHHHMTLGILALFFLTLEQRRAGGKNQRDHSPADRLGTERVPA
jgi:SRSO17 transposase